MGSSWGDGRWYGFSFLTSRRSHSPCVSVCRVSGLHPCRGSAIISRANCGNCCLICSRICCMSSCCSSRMNDRISLRSSVRSVSPSSSTRRSASVRMHWWLSSIWCRMLSCGVASYVGVSHITSVGGLIMGGGVYVCTVGVVCSVGLLHFHVTRSGGGSRSQCRRDGGDVGDVIGGCPAQLILSPTLYPQAPGLPIVAAVAAKVSFDFLIWTLVGLRRPKDQSFQRQNGSCRGGAKGWPCFFYLIQREHDQRKEVLDSNPLGA